MEIKRITKAQHGDLVGHIDDRALSPTPSPVPSR